MFLAVVFAILFLIFLYAIGNTANKSESIDQNKNSHRTKVDGADKSKEDHNVKPDSIIEQENSSTKTNFEKPVSNRKAEKTQDHNMQLFISELSLFAWDMLHQEDGKFLDAANDIAASSTLGDAACQESVGIGANFYGTDYLTNYFMTSLSKKKRRVLEARLFGISIGLLVCKAATVSQKKVQKPALKKFLNGFNFEGETKKEIINLATKFVSFWQGLDLNSEDGPIRVAYSHELHDMVHALMGEDWGDHFANPLQVMHLYIAIMTAYSTAQLISEIDMETYLEDKGLIR